MSAKDTNVTVTVDTENITKINKNCMVVFSDDLGDPIAPACPIAHPSKNMWSWVTCLKI